MYIYAGIDEAGYGPMFGPLLVSRSVIAIPNLLPDPDGSNPPKMWQRLSKAVCKNLSQRNGRIPVNDSKKVHTQASGVKHLETAVLSFAALADHNPQDLGQLLDCLGEQCHHHLENLPWYTPSPDRPWSKLPCANTPGELAIARSLLTTTTKRIGVEVLDLGASVVFEDRFNEMVAHTRSKAATSFTFVAGHLQSIWNTHGHHHPTVVVDRQSGRMRYRELLALNFPDSQITILQESPTASSYRLKTAESNNTAHKQMNVRFEVDGDGRHMPVALASMISKYLRELLMARFKAWFTEQAPQIKPTAGYGSDAKRFWLELKPVISDLSIKPEQLRRRC